ncbi:corrinoid adenosyltransferase isoform X2 [Hyalella azteca]|uniref:Corrinoid adenosyltransferase MMAB n=1 Tax=Hyalella azteca TaxID=294128 RepID=A0A979FTN6_HYAAZ|nr:corrinoid adenosyltransferase isoform X2 [Hyalella azteca]
MNYYSSVLRHSNPLVGFIPSKSYNVFNVVRGYPCISKGLSSTHTSWTSKKRMDSSCGISSLHLDLLSSNNLTLKIGQRGMKIYTRTGDRGTSATFTGTRHPKDHEIFEALGNIDELSAHIGLAREVGCARKHQYCEQLERIQCLLQDAASAIAQVQPLPSGGLSPEETSSDQSSPWPSSGVNASHIQELEAWIDEYSETLPPLRNFILPGGGEAGAGLHVTRAVCRRAERSLVALKPAYALDPNINKYINRLSDFLFTIARYASIADNCKEVIYINPAKPKKAPPCAESQKLTDA